MLGNACFSMPALKPWVLTGLLASALVACGGESTPAKTTEATVSGTVQYEDRPPPGLLLQILGDWLRGSIGGVVRPAQVYGARPVYPIARLVAGRPDKGPPGVWLVGRVEFVPLQ